MNNILTFTNPQNLCRCCYIVVMLRCGNHYKTLKISQDASAQEIKSAYFTLSKKCHPDTHEGNKGKTQEFIKINEAYSVLSCKKARQHYDQHLNTTRTGGPSRSYTRNDHEGFHYQRTYPRYHNDPNFTGTEFSNEKIDKKLFQRLLFRSTLITCLLVFALYCDVFTQQLRNIAEQKGTEQNTVAVKLLMTTNDEKD